MSVPDRSAMPRLRRTARAPSASAAIRDSGVGGGPCACATEASPHDSSAALHDSSARPSTRTPATRRKVDKRRQLATELWRPAVVASAAAGSYLLIELVELA